MKKKKTIKQLEAEIKREEARIKKLKKERELIKKRRQMKVKLLKLKAKKYVSDDEIKTAKTLFNKLRREMKGYHLNLD